MQTSFRSSSWLLLIPIVICASTSAHADVNAWSTIGPPGGSVFAMAQDASARNTLYAVTGNGFYRTADAGASWARTNIATLNNAGLTGIATDPKIAGRVYVLSGDGSVYRSDDSGTTFTRISTGAITALTLQIAVAANGTTIYFGAGGNIYRSIDSGSTWSLRGTVTGVGTGNYLHDLQIDPSNPDVVYASSFAKGVFKSIDGGANWQMLYDPVGAGHSTGMLAATVDVINPQKIWVSTNSELIFSSNGGSSWQATTINTPVTDIHVSTVNPQIVFAAQSDGRVQRSLDGGATWSLSSLTRNNAFSIGIRHFYTDSVDVNRVFLFGNGPLLSSGDTGATWQRADTNIFASWPRGLHATQAGRILFPVMGMGLFDIAPDGKSTGGVLAPSLSVLSGIDPPDINQILSLPVANERLLVLLPNGKVARTENAGGAWIEAQPFPFGAVPTRLAVASKGGHNAYAVAHSGIYVSTDYGDHWSLSSTGIPVGYSAQAIAATIDPNVVFAIAAPASGGTAVVYKSIDGGASWTASSLSGSVSRLSVSPHDAQTVLANVGSDLMMSIDGGSNWTSPRYPTGQTTCCITDIFFDPSNANVLYGSDGRTIFRSSDAGKNWVALPLANNPFELQSVIVNPNRPNQVFAAVNNRGVLEMTVLPDVALTYQSGIVGNGALPFTLTAKNNGFDDITDLRVTVKLSGSFTSFSPIAAQNGATCTVAGDSGTCAVASLKPGASISFQFTSAVGASSPIHVSAQSAIGGSDAVPANNVVEVDVNVPGPVASGSSGGGGGGRLSLEMLLALLAVLSIRSRWTRPRRPA